MTAIYRDLRRFSPPVLEDILLRSNDHLVVSASQLANSHRHIRDRDVVAVVPDFLEYARLLSVGQFGQLLAKAGTRYNLARALLAAACAALRHPTPAAGSDFWLVAQALLRFDLALLRMFHGVVVLHPYLTDFALSLGRDDFLAHFAHQAARWQYWGVWTYQLPLALSALMRLGLSPSAVIFATAQRDIDSQFALAAARKNALFSSTHFLVDCQPIRVGTVDISIELAKKFSVDGTVCPASMRGDAP
ncbi:MAG: hypothetical protein N2Z21_06260 [Candidatus Sumerlaeaceae bacterium]|nr:hypothetical protein [Candidatus Sumerlaeaceae bacterium]